MDDGEWKDRKVARAEARALRTVSGRRRVEAPDTVRQPIRNGISRVYDDLHGIGRGLPVGVRDIAGYYEVHRLQRREHYARFVVFGGVDIHEHGVAGPPHLPGVVLYLDVVPR